MSQSLSSSTSISTVVIKIPSAPTLVTTPQKSIEDLIFKLGNISDDILFEIELDQMRTLLIVARDTLFRASLTFYFFI